MNRAIIFESFRLVTIWGLQDMLSLKRRQRGGLDEHLTSAGALLRIGTPCVDRQRSPLRWDALPTYCSSATFPDCLTTAAGTTIQFDP